MTANVTESATSTVETWIDRNGSNGAQTLTGVLTVMNETVRARPGKLNGRRLELILEP